MSQLAIQLPTLVKLVSLLYLSIGANYRKLIMEGIVTDTKDKIILILPCTLQQKCMITWYYYKQNKAKT
jgi:hypothetical protein